jgi:ABC-type antimicrobial peptide transport system permease subunit
MRKEIVAGGIVLLLIGIVGFVYVNNSISALNQKISDYESISGSVDRLLHSEKETDYQNAKSQRDMMQNVGYPGVGALVIVGILALVAGVALNSKK